MMVAGLSVTTLLLILVAGVGAGFVGYAVGASSLVSYPALLALGIPPVMANASNGAPPFSRPSPSPWAAIRGGCGSARASWPWKGGH